LAAFDRAGRTVRVYLAHDLDKDNVELLRQGRRTAVPHHDLRHACRILLQAHGALPGRPSSRLSQIQVTTPYKQPERPT
jgi:LacI family transcriptional regulator